MSYASLFTLLVGLVAGVVSGVVGTGSSIMLLPVLVWSFGPKQAVPIMAVAAVMANLARVLAWWREVDWRAFLAYALPGIPAAMLGARTLLRLPSAAIDIGLGLFFLAMIPGRRWLEARRIRLSLGQLGLAGAVIGFLTGLVLSTGPLSIPAFMAYGLTKGALLSTEAATSLFIYVTKVATFRSLGAMPLAIFAKGLIVGASLMLGTFAGKALVMRMDRGTFQLLLDGMMLFSGLFLIAAAFR
ncbi:sulfite exporter TauE/SafE family protein [Bosea sp. (in: a-proteobacteria)]|uniref:sulfite exporter TauE/SafE family protein n=1 Tax=Bosea sp. (in: a-proteobacteria) TaxID=1871050 RepID=UPI001AD2A406|nr:sulfite exporter TauE/SafE family protein [Bosea sp. (in: a-proteobacteria)]MBN9438682.1 sulfite exporter TauE/SafE family protein [Bosea sp. (in: a-proteobacteria)]